MTAPLAGTLVLARFVSVSISCAEYRRHDRLGVAIGYRSSSVSRFREEIHRVADRGAWRAPSPPPAAAVLFSGRHASRSAFSACSSSASAISVRWAGRDRRASPLAVVYGLTTSGAARSAPAAGEFAAVRSFTSIAPADGLWRIVWPRSVMRPSLARFVRVVAFFYVFGLPFLRLPWLRRRHLAGFRRRPGHAAATSCSPRVSGRDPIGRGRARRRHRLTARASRVAQTYAFSRWLAARPGIRRVDSFVDLHPSLDLATYQQMAALAPALRPPELVEALRHTLGEHVAMLIATTDSGPTSEEARAVVRGPARASAVDGEVMVPADRLRPRLHRARSPPRPARDRPRRRRHLRRAVPAPRLRAAAAQGDRDESALDQRLLRRAHVDLPGRSPGDVARFRRGRSRRPRRCSCSASSSACRWTTRCSC